MLDLTNIKKDNKSYLYAFLAKNSENSSDPTDLINQLNSEDQWEVVNDFTPAAGKTVTLTDHAEDYSAMHVIIERTTAGPGTSSTYFNVNGSGPTFLAVNMLLIHLFFFNAGNNTIGCCIRSSTSNKVLNQNLGYLYSARKMQGSITLSAGAQVWDGTEHIIVTGKRKYLKPKTES